MVFFLICGSSIASKSSKWRPEVNFQSPLLPLYISGLDGPNIFFLFKKREDNKIILTAWRLKRSVTNLSHGRFVVKDPYIIIKIQRHCFISVANILILMLSLMAFTIWLSRTLQWQLSVCMAEHCSPFSFRNTNAENHHFLPLSQKCMHALTGGIEWWRLVTPEGTAPTSLLKEREREMGKPAFLKRLSSTLSSVTTDTPPANHYKPQTDRWHFVCTQSYALPFKSLMSVIVLKEINTFYSVNDALID